MELKSEKSLKEYLKKLSDDTIIKYYLDVEYTPFPVLVIEEYTRRFKQKTKEQIVKDLKFQTRLAKRKTQELGKMAKKNKLVHELTSEKSEEIVKQAKKKGYEISETILQKSGMLKSRLKKGTKSRQKDLDLLEKLGALKKAGIITNKEFQEKKKKVLAKI